MNVVGHLLAAGEQGHPHPGVFLSVPVMGAALILVLGCFPSSERAPGGGSWRDLGFAADTTLRDTPKETWSVQ